MADGHQCEVSRLPRSWLAATCIIFAPLALAGVDMPRTVDQRLTVVTYMNEISDLFGYLQVSAAANGLHPQILGYGDKAWWPDGLGAKINALRDFVHARVADAELVLFVDAFDVMIFAGREEIVTSFEAMEQASNRSLFFNAEKDCFPFLDDICTDDYPQSPFYRWRYLNSGSFIGRGWAMKQMLRNSVDNVMPGSDQAYYQRYFKAFPERVGLDTGCKLLCAIQGLGSSFDVLLQPERSRIINVRFPGHVPAIVHFVSTAHWSVWKAGVPITVISNVFAILYPIQSERLFGSVQLTLHTDGTQQQRLFDLRGLGREGYLSCMRLSLCIRCRLLGSEDRECDFAESWSSDTCFWAGIHILVLAISLPVFTMLACAAVRRHTLSREKAADISGKERSRFGIGILRYRGTHVASRHSRSALSRIDV
eukprot:gnl/TRDRNA2_/TRDRNA2_92993_c0_seq1.p1 gnl/TRDRNA2_/TRDRNA2_92993_c0~~gnl/TRDRNA2_/TRDRNA2_92993_c0_seq1.p1  ORF type:complete len:424 (+),score=40.43 gnl/TRDRNA2_/TRDRNA2_92993_c0_seq1:105-1376(+)